MEFKEKVKIVIPIYQKNLSENEYHSLRQCCTILSKYPIVVIKPKSLILDEIGQKFPGISFMSFHDDYFKDRKGYNRLMLSSEFYGAFSDTEYILLYQLDAFVFRDELLEWCNKSYDYIGAPWVQKKRNFISQFFRNRRIEKRKKLSNFYDIIHKVGNGGFSLRKVATCLEITEKEKESIETDYRLYEDTFMHEDIYWALEPHRKGYKFLIPDYKEAAYFSFDRYPQTCMEITGKLPFGCHEWSYKKSYPFWKKYIFVK